MHNAPMRPICVCVVATAETHIPLSDAECYVYFAANYSIDMPLLPCAGAGKDKRHVLCNVDLQAALKEHGVTTNKPPYYI